MSQLRFTPCTSHLLLEPTCWVNGAWINLLSTIVIAWVNLLFMITSSLQKLIHKCWLFCVFYLLRTMIYKTVNLLYFISFILIYLQQIHCMLKKNATDISICTVLPCYVCNNYLFLFLRTLIKFFILLVTWFWHIEVIFRPLLEAKWKVWVKVYC